MTHFATADEPSRASSTSSSAASRRSSRSSGGCIPAASSTPRTAPRCLREPRGALRHGALRHRDLRHGPVREDPAAQGLEPALSLRSYVADVKRGARGRQRRLRAHLVGARGTRASRCCRSATATATGVASRTAAEVLIRGRRRPVVGTVSMDNITVDVGAGHRRAARRRGDADRRGRRRARAPPRSSRASWTRSTTRSRAGSHPACRAWPAPRRADLDAIPSRASSAHAAVRVARSALSRRAGMAGRRPRARRVPRPAVRSRTSTSSSRATRSAAARAFADAAGAHLFPAVGALRRMARDRARSLVAGRHHAAARRQHRGRPGAARLHGQRDGAAARRHRHRCSTRTAGRPTWRARRLRAVSERSFEDDPLRVLRLARFACELALRGRNPRRCALRPRAPPAHRRGRAGALVLRAAPADRERRPGRAGSGWPSASGCWPHLLPELDGLKGVEQNPYHHLDVWGHTLEVLERLVEIEREPEACSATLGERIGAELRPPAGGRAHARAGAAPRRAAARRRQAGDAGGQRRGPRAVLGPRRRRRRHGAGRVPAAAREHRAGRLRRRAGAASPAARLPRARAPADAPARVPLHACVRAGGAGGDGAVGRRPARDARRSARATRPWRRIWSWRASWPPRRSSGGPIRRRRRCAATS